MTLLANVFPKLRIPKSVVRKKSKKRRFTGPFNKQHGKRAQTDLMISVKQIEFEKVSLSDMQYLKSVS